LQNHKGALKKACTVTSFSRDSFYHFEQPYERDGGLTLRESCRKKPALKNREGFSAETGVLAFTFGQSACGQQ
jgi:hypothetical protein